MEEMTSEQRAALALQEASAAMVKRRLSVRDIRDFRDELGFDMVDVPPSMADRTSASAGLVWLLKRQEEPGYTFEDALGCTSAELDAEMKRLAPEIDKAVQAALQDAETAEAEADGDPLPAPGNGQWTPGEAKSATIPDELSSSVSSRSVASTV